MARTRSQCAVKTRSHPGGGASISKTQRRCARAGEEAIAAGSQGLLEQQKKMKKQHQEPLIFGIGAGSKLVVMFAPFARLVREITEFHSRKVTCWTAEALLSLQAVAERFLEKMFANLLTIRVKRIIVMQKQEQLSQAGSKGAQHIVTETATTATTRQQHRQESSLGMSTPAKRSQRFDVEALAEGPGIHRLAKRVRRPCSLYPARDWVVSARRNS